MLIEIWADVVCGWAHIGKKRMEKALAAWQGEPVTVVWRPFQRDPMAPAHAEPLERTLSDPIAEDALRACTPPGLSNADNRARVAEEAAAEGLGPQWGAEWRPNTLEAHRLIALAYEQGGAELQDRVVERVLNAHFVEVRDIGDPSVLAGIAEEAGLAAAARFDAPAPRPGAELVRELLLTGKAKGVRTSPTIVANGLALEGAQPPEVIREFLEDASRHTPRRLPAEVERLRHAESLLDQRDPLGALTLLRPLMDEHGDDRGVRLLAARAYFGSAQLNRARAALESLVAESPDDSYARHLLGRTLQRQGRHEEAAVHLAMAAAMTPDYTP
ncbi:Predicted dithiol-disulfide isomerase, DsbA family [Nonomuraea maritima]|uniref:Predicted dithiol-disulfide isomerase, DsbA family n=1 Tax=Nonomuraea maritima TaxID=683260 RepID=A0A1G9DBN7_9ACTN|nr:DsbA family protein [Nonomuraea maritima]SDK61311.1 Predicted dithiol-disulfide isomerase, DsbA family [Nonomuraea maritima]